MRGILGHAPGGALLSLACIIGAALPGVAGEWLRPSLATMAASPAPFVVERLTPSATALPAAQLTASSPSPLLAQELTNKRAPIPVGPSTVVPILLYHYIRGEPIPE